MKQSFDFGNHVTVVTTPFIVVQTVPPPNLRHLPPPLLEVLPLIKGRFTMHAAQLSGAVRHNSARCRAYRERVAVRRRQPLCRAAPIGSNSIFAARYGSYARASHVDSTNRKILQNHVSVSIRESRHGALVHREQTQAARCRRLGSCCGAEAVAARCYAAQPRRVHREPAYILTGNHEVWRVSSTSWEQSSVLTTNVVFSLDVSKCPGRQTENYRWPLHGIVGSGSCKVSTS